jgi:hypothetical protein
MHNGKAIVDLTDEAPLQPPRAEKGQPSSRFFRTFSGSRPPHDRATMDSGFKCSRRRYDRMTDVDTSPLERFTPNSHLLNAHRFPS